MPGPTCRGQHRRASIKSLANGPFGLGVGDVDPVAIGVRVGCGNLGVVGIGGMNDQSCRCGLLDASPRPLASSQVNRDKFGRLDTPPLLDADSNGVGGRSA